MQLLLSEELFGQIVAATVTPSKLWGNDFCLYFIPFEQIHGTLSGVSTVAVFRFPVTQLAMQAGIVAGSQSLRSMEV